VLKLWQINFSEVEQIPLVRSQFREAYQDFKALACPEEYPKVCGLHEIFETNDSMHHNCIGCNMADSVTHVLMFLKTYNGQERIQFSYMTFIIICYLLVERIDTIFDIIKLDEEYRSENFKVLSTIRRWANFIKHPKAFVMTHHAEYTFVGSPKNKALHEHASVVVDRPFVDKYYTGDKHDTELFKKIENKENILVVFPDIISLTNDLCMALDNTIALIKDNSVYRQSLNKRSTFLDYWSGPIQE